MARRRAGLIHEDVPEGVVVIDTASLSAHALDPVAASVWKGCEGAPDAETLADHLGLSTSTVEVAIDALESAGLIEAPRARGITRRAALAGGVGLGAALVTSLALPSPAMAASGSPPATTPGSVSSSGGAAGSSPGTGASPTGGAKSTTGQGSLAFTGANAESEASVGAALILSGAALVVASRQTEPPPVPDGN